MEAHGLHVDDLQKLRILEPELGNDTERMNKRGMKNGLVVLGSNCLVKLDVPNIFQLYIQCLYKYIYCLNINRSTFYIFFVNSYSEPC